MLGGNLPRLKKKGGQGAVDTQKRQAICGRRDTMGSGTCPSMIRLLGCLAPGCGDCGHNQFSGAMTTRSLVIKLILTDTLTSNLDILLLQLEMAEDRCSGSFILALSSRHIAVAMFMSGGPAGKHAAMTTTM